MTQILGVLVEDQDCVPSLGLPQLGHFGDEPGLPLSEVKIIFKNSTMRNMSTGTSPVPNDSYLPITLSNAVRHHRANDLDKI